MTAPGSCKLPTVRPGSASRAPPKNSSTPGRTCQPARSYEPGDLVFFGQSSEVTHVGMVVRSGEMVDAPDPGAFVRTEPFPTTIGRSWGEDVYLGATRPAAAEAGAMRRDHACPHLRQRGWIASGRATYASSNRPAAARHARSLTVAHVAPILAVLLVAARLARAHRSVVLRAVALRPWVRGR